MPLPILFAVQLAVAAAAAPPAGPPPAARRDEAPALGPGVSRELAAWRARRVGGVRYDLSLDVTRADTVRGRVTVRFTRRGAGDAILDFRGPALRALRVNGRPAAGVRWDSAHVRVPAALLRPGANSVELAFDARVAPAGASVISYRDAQDGARYLYTLLVPADANALFPCFDQPDLKARVTLSLTTPAGWTSVANGARAAVRDSGGARVVRFAETRPISTYLVAFAAGPWHTVTDTVQGIAVTMYVRRSRAAEVEADSLVRQNARAIRWLEGYFGRPYPFGKYDFVLAPAFPFGGMEHPGAVFYNEESFIFRERPTLPQRLGRTATIYHEVAHQWFGDLVTMRWFDDLWLKEGFSTYMAARMQDALDPGGDAWKTFYLRNKPVAYAVDASAGTVPVWQALANLDQAKSNYGPIVYNKAPGILRQLEFLVGERAFRAGLRDFLARHAYGNAGWQDLLASLGRASGRDLGAWGGHYILRPGLPVLEASHDGAGRAVVTQRAADPAVSGARPWPVRLELLAWDTAGPARRVRVQLAGAQASVALPAPLSREALLFANAGDHAYALTLLDDAGVRWLERRIGRVDDALLRAQLWGALWDEVREARLDPARFVALALRELPAERDEQIATVLLGRATRAATRYLGDARRDSLAPALEAALRAGADDARRPYGVRKAHLDAWIGAAQTPAALAAIDGLLDGDSAAGAPLRPPTRWAIVTRLVERGAATAETRLAAEERRDSTSEGRRRRFVAGAARGDAATKAAYFRRYFADTALNEEWVTASLDAFNAPAHQPLTRAWLLPALDSLPWVQRNRRIFFLGSWLGAVLGGQATPESLASVDAWLAGRPGLAPDLRRKVLQAADEPRRVVASRRRWGT